MLAARRCFAEAGSNILGMWPDLVVVMLVPDIALESWFADIEALVPVGIAVQASGGWMSLVEA